MFKMARELFEPNELEELGERIMTAKQELGAPE
jgi:hypothetical protein